MTARRQLLLVTGAWALGATSPLALHAQPAANVHRVGILGLGSASENAVDVDAFRKRLGRLAYVEGRNLDLQTRFANGQVEALPALASDLVRLDVDVIVKISTRRRRRRPRR